jgi:hypothetical protein
VSQVSVRQTLDAILPLAAAQPDFALVLNLPGPGEPLVVAGSPSGPVIRSARRHAQLQAVEQAHADEEPVSGATDLPSSLADLIRSGAIVGADLSSM